MKYNFSEDLRAVREILELTQEEFAAQLGVERCYISASEKKYYKSKRSSDVKLGEDKVKLARIQYRGHGRYIDEILI